ASRAGLANDPGPGSHSKRSDTGGATETERLGGTSAPERSVLTRGAARGSAGARASINRSSRHSAFRTGGRPDAVKHRPAASRPKGGNDGEDPPGRGQRDEP